MDLLAVDLLEADDEHRAVRLQDERGPHLDDVVRPEGEEEPIEGGVMQLAQGDAVAVGCAGYARMTVSLEA